MTSIANVPRRRALTAARTAVSMLRAQPFSIGTATAVLVLGMLQHSLFATPVDLPAADGDGFRTRRRAGPVVDSPDLDAVRS